MRRTWSSGAVFSATASVSVVGLVIAAACNLDRAPTSPPGSVTPVVASIALSPKQVTLTVGDSQPITATPEDSAGAGVTGATVTWASSADTVATVSSIGMVHAIPDRGRRRSRQA